MEAKDTVMSDEQRKKIINENLGSNPNMHIIGQIVGSKLLQTQAEISFKAGEKAGARKVVEWVNDNHGDLGTIEQPVLTLNGVKWQAFVKGLEGE
jgi:hypothetical protein